VSQRGESPGKNGKKNNRHENYRRMLGSIIAIAPNRKGVGNRLEQRWWRGSRVSKRKVGRKGPGEGFRQVVLIIQ